VCCRIVRRRGHPASVTGSARCLLARQDAEAFIRRAEAFIAPLSYRSPAAERDTVAMVTGAPDVAVCRLESFSLFRRFSLEPTALDHTRTASPVHSLYPFVSTNVG